MAQKYSQELATTVKSRVGYDAIRQIRQVRVALRIGLSGLVLSTLPLFLGAFWVWIVLFLAFGIIAGFPASREVIRERTHGQIINMAEKLNIPILHLIALNPSEIAERSSQYFRTEAHRIILDELSRKATPLRDGGDRSAMQEFYSTLVKLGIELRYDSIEDWFDLVREELQDKLAHGGYSYNVATKDASEGI